MVWVVGTFALRTLSVGAVGSVNLKRNRATAVELSAVLEFDVNVANVPGVTILRSVFVAMRAFKYEVETTDLISVVLLPQVPGAVVTAVQPVATLH